MGMRDRDGMMNGKGRKKCRLVQDSSHRSTFQMSFFQRKHVLIIYTWMWDSDIDW